MIREILLLGDPRLYRVSEEITPDDEPMLDQWITDLHDSLMDFRRTYGAGRAIAARRGVQPQRRRRTTARAVG